MSHLAFLFFPLFSFLVKMQYSFISFFPSVTSPFHVELLC